MTTLIQWLQRHELEQTIVWAGNVIIICGRTKKFIDNQNTGIYVGNIIALYSHSKISLIIKIYVCMSCVQCNGLNSYNIGLLTFIYNYNNFLKYRVL